MKRIVSQKMMWAHVPWADLHLRWKWKWSIWFKNSSIWDSLVYLFRFTLWWSLNFAGSYCNNLICMHSKPHTACSDNLKNVECCRLIFVYFPWKCSRILLWIWGKWWNWVNKPRLQYQYPTRCLTCWHCLNSFGEWFAFDVVDMWILTQCASMVITGFTIGASLFWLAHCIHPPFWAWVIIGDAMHFSRMW